ncbi:TetR/AcrR family transcriptional regulator [Nocardia vermiculata]|nr:TetR/AcrR family transcriptional regulator [Nocardia vermiculata]
MARTENRREEIMALAAELFAERGISATSVREIGDRAGVFSGSLYHYFRSKNALVQEILSGYMTDIDRRFGEVVANSNAPRDTVGGLIRQTLQVIDVHPHPTAIYQQNRQYLREHGLLETVDSASRKIRNYWLDALEAGVADGTFRSDIPAELFYRTVRDSLWASMHWPSRAEHSTEDFAELLTKLFFDGFLR